MFWRKITLQQHQTNKTSIFHGMSQKSTISLPYSKVETVKKCLIILLQLDNCYSEVDMRWLFYIYYWHITCHILQYKKASYRKINVWKNEIHCIDEWVGERVISYFWFGLSNFPLSVELSLSENYVCRIYMFFFVCFPP